MFRSLNPGPIGIRLPMREVLRLAGPAGFEGVDLNIREAARLAQEESVGHVAGLFREAGLRVGSWALPVNWRGDEATYREGLEGLPRLAALGQRLGSLRVCTFVPPASDERPFEENFRWHVDRLRPIAEALKDHGCRLGLEFIGPKTSRLGRRHEFIYTMGGMLELGEAIGTGNVGLLLDSWHLYTSHGTVEDLGRLRVEQVVCVHINDAPAGVPVDEQIDNVRCLPGETGIIDLAGFLKALKRIGYDGPVTPEPFSQKVRQMPPEEAARTTGEALTRVWRAAGLG